MDQQVSMIFALILAPKGIWLPRLRGFIVVLVTVRQISHPKKAWVCHYHTVRLCQTLRCIKPNPFNRQKSRLASKYRWLYVTPALKRRANTRLSC